jgi:hypothetical protein
MFCVAMRRPVLTEGGRMLELDGFICTIPEEAKKMKRRRHAGVFAYLQPLG